MSYRTSSCTWDTNSVFWVSTCSWSEACLDCELLRLGMRVIFRDKRFRFCESRTEVRTPVKLIVGCVGSRLINCCIGANWCITSLTASATTLRHSL